MGFRQVRLVDNQRLNSSGIDGGTIFFGMMRQNDVEQIIHFPFFKCSYLLRLFLHIVHAQDDMPNHTTLLCFASILFPLRRINLPLSELNWWSLKPELCQHSLPKVRFAAKTLPKDFSARSERSKPYLSVKSIFAAVFIGQCGRLTWRCILAARFVPGEKW